MYIFQLNWFLKPKTTNKPTNLRLAFFHLQPWKHVSIIIVDYAYDFSLHLNPSIYKTVTTTTFMTNISLNINQH